MNEYSNKFHKTKYVAFWIKDKQFFKKYKKTWHKSSNSINILSKSSSAAGRTGCRPVKAHVTLVRFD